MGNPSSDMVLEEMMLRLSQLSQQLTSKEQEASRAVARAILLEKELSASKQEAQDARDELRREALQRALLEQRVQAMQDEHQKLAVDLHTVTCERARLDATLQSVHKELSITKETLEARTRELEEQGAFYEGVLETKESSLGSLQQLLAAHERASKDQQQVWEEEKAMLKETMVAAAQVHHDGLIAAAHTDSPGMLRDALRRPDQAILHHSADSPRLVPAASQETMEQLAALKQQLLDAEQDRRALGQRTQHLESHLREREKLLVKANKKIQDLNRMLATQADAAAQQPAQPSVAIAAGQRAADATAMKTLQHQLELLQEAFQEEQHKRDKLRTKLGNKLAAQSHLLNTAEQHAASLRQQLQAAQHTVQRQQQEVSQLQLHLDQQHAAQDGKISQQLTMLQSELDSMRTRHEAAVKIMQDAHKAQLEQERSRHHHKAQELEQQLQKLAAGQRLEDKASVQAASSRLRGLESDLQEQRNSVSKLQHSLYLMRAHWGGVKKLLLKLQEGLRDGAKARAMFSAGGGKEDADLVAILSDSQLEALASRLLRDWDPAQLNQLDSMMEDSFSAGCQVLDAALMEWQSLVRVAQHAAKRASAETAEQQANKIKSQPLLHAAQLQLKQAQEQAAAAEHAASTARLSTADVSEQLVAAENERDRLQRELTAAQDALAETKRANVSAQNDRQQLRLALQGSKGELEALLASRDRQLAAAQRTIEDLTTNVGVLHVRLEHLQASFEQVDKLKASLATIMSEVAVPTLISTAALAAATGQTGSLVQASASSCHRANQLHKLLQTILHGGDAPVGCCEADGYDVEHQDNSSAAVQARLEKTAADVLGQAQAAVAGCGLMETQLWELDRSMQGVGVLRSQLAALHTELTAGRNSTAAVLAKELMALMDMATSAQGMGCTSTSSNACNSAAGPATLLLPAPILTNQAGAGPVTSGPGGSICCTKIQTDLNAARQVGLDVASHVKTVEALLQAVCAALPAWMQLVRAEAVSGYRSELSKARVQAAHKHSSMRAGHPHQTAADLAMAHGLAAQCMNSMEQSLALLKRQVDMACQAGALAPDSAIHQQLEQLQQDRQRAATQLLGVLQSASAQAAETARAAQPDRDTFDANESPVAGSSIASPGMLQGGAWAANGMPHSGNHYLTGAMAAGAAGVQQGPSGALLGYIVPAGTDVSSISDKLSDQLNLQNAVSNVRGDLAHLQDDNTHLKADVVMLLNHMSAVQERTSQLVQALRASLPLNEDLAQGLKDGVLGTLPSLQSAAAAEHAAPASKQEAGKESKQPQSEELAPEDEAAGRLLAESIRVLQQLVAQFLAQLQAAMLNSQQVAATQQVAPLQARCQQLEGQLTAAQADVVVLEQQVAELVNGSEQQLEHARDACITAAVATFDDALSSIRKDMRNIEKQIKTLKEEAEHALDGAMNAWANAASNAASSASQAMAALSQTTTQLQTQLAAQIKDQERLSAEAQEMVKQSALQAEESQAELKRAQTELSLARHRLSHADAGQGALEQETASLRRTLRMQSMRLQASEHGLTSDGGSSDYGGASSHGPHDGHSEWEPGSTSTRHRLGRGASSVLSGPQGDGAASSGGRSSDGNGGSQ